MNNKQILITGATNGIGLAAAEARVAGRPVTLFFRTRRRDEIDCQRCDQHRRIVTYSVLTANATKTVVVVFASLLIWPVAAEAQLKVLISGGFSGAYEQLLPEFERTTGINVTTGSGSSQGTGPQTIGAQLARGVPANVVILSREGLNELIAANRITAGTDVDLARVPLGVAVRAGTPKPDVSTVEAVKQLLLNAKSVAVPGSTSGIWLITDLFPRLGIAEKVNVKSTPRGTGATSMVATGEAEIAVMPVSEILHATGIDFAGTIPPEIQFVQVFSAALVAGSGQIEDSKRLIKFLASGRASEAIRNSGMEPLANSR